MTKKYILLFSLVLLGMTFSCSNEMQKKLKPVRTAIKNKKGGDAANLVSTLLKDSLVVLEPKLFDLGKQAQILVNDVENEKIYLKQPYDTIRFFNSTYGIFDFILQCEKIEQRRLAEGGKKMKFHKGNRSILHRYYPNLCAAGRYFYSKRNYKEVTKFQKMVLDVPNFPIWGDDRTVVNSENYTDGAYLYLRSAFFNKDYANVEKYKDIVMTDTAYRSNTLEMLSLASLALGDTTRYVDYLVQGLREYPLSSFFFTRLTDNITEKKDYRIALALADSMLTVDSTNVLFMVSKSVALLNLQRNEEAIKVSQNILNIDSSVVVAYYYIGAAYCNLANNLTLPTNINSLAYKTVAEKQKYFYTEAKPYIEYYRMRCPEEKKRWAPLLYRVYLSLNMGKKFEEIEKVLSEM